MQLPPNPFPAAIEVMQTHGHTKFDLQNDKGEVCLVGSVYVALGAKVVNGPLLWEHPAFAVMAEVASELFPVRNGTDQGRAIGPWTTPRVNNHPDTTEEDALLILKHASVAYDELLEHQDDPRRSAVVETV